MAKKLVSPVKRSHGHGSVSIQGTSYVATFKNLITGRPSRASFATDEEAQVFLDAWYAEKTAKKLADSKRVAGPNPHRLPPAPRASAGTFQELADRWRDAKVGEYDPGTWRSYDGARRALNHWLGDIKLDQISEADFIQYRTAREKGIDWTGKSASGTVPIIKAKTINKHVAVANQIFKWATDRKLIDHNPVALLGKLNEDPFEPAVVTADQIDALMEAAADPYKLEFYLFGHLAMRWGEGLGLRDGDPFIEDGNLVIRVRKEVTEDREGSRRRERAGAGAERIAADSTKLILLDVKSEASRRDLIASDPIREQIERARHAKRGKPNPWKVLRPTSTGQLYREGNWLRDAWRPAIKRAGLQDVTNPDGRPLSPHSLRHSRLSIMAASGKVTPVNLSAFAGHDDVAFTLREYGSHFKKSRIDPAAYLATEADDAPQAKKPKRTTKRGG